jgi:thiamine biosynthesis lipoprotein
MLASLTGVAHAGVSLTSDVPLRRGQYVMGTVLEAAIDAPDRTRGDKLLDTLFATARRLDSILTSYDANSSLCRLSRDAGGGPEAVDPMLADALRSSKRWSRITGGTFDVTVGPLVALWREAAHDGTAPSSAAIAQALAVVGIDKCIVDSGDRAQLMRRGMALDMGGFGKGYALDAMAAQARAGGVQRALLSFGQSSIIAFGAPAARIAIRDPAGGFAGVITLHDRALSVSGSFGQFVEIGGRRYGHVIDPRIGRPLMRDLEACVLAPSAAEAEALSKALLILGSARGIAMLERLPDVEAILIEAGGPTWTTSGWNRASGFSPLNERSHASAD